ncbi:hypothetical protein RJ639_043438 [Escallonia herrerae]|uniref:FAR1 domain-containing protein n=1 Tax=Escallonia herrerae TaxID=1293975 RepID=A0AA89B353_9ASTE|nr:hypothetical protein RJ639_043438 [Escallonia herrerae]
MKNIDTQEAAYEFYNQCTLLNGFGTHKHNADMIMAIYAIFRRQFVCSKQGFKKQDDKRLKGMKKRRRDLRTGWEAMIQFQDVHNHPITITPSKVIRHRPYSKYHYTNVYKSLMAGVNNEA